jgi:hypothetical protein
MRSGLNSVLQQSPDELYKGFGGGKGLFRLASFRFE